MKRFFMSVSLMSLLLSPSFAEVIVFAAASTSDVMQDLADLYKGETGNSVLLNPASSGILARQLEQGASADIYISASKKWMDYVKSLDLVDRWAPFAGNRIVLITPLDSTASPVDIKKGFDFPSSFTGRLSIGDPEHVPAGNYARSALEYYSWYGALKSRLLPAANVRAALAVVELGETERGIVYRTDALKSSKVKIIGVFPAASHTAISYFCALLKQASPSAEKFYDFISTSDEASEILTRYGFEI